MRWFVAGRGFLSVEKDERQRLVQLNAMVERQTIVDASEKSSLIVGGSEGAESPQQLARCRYPALHLDMYFGYATAEVWQCRKVEACSANSLGRGRNCVMPCGPCPPLIQYTPIVNGSNVKHCEVHSGSCYLCDTYSIDHHHRSPHRSEYPTERPSQSNAPYHRAGVRSGIYPLI